MYDDIAHHESNPKPGVIINNPKGHDVYAGVPKVQFYFSCINIIVIVIFITI